MNRRAVRQSGVFLLRHGETSFNRRYLDNADPIDFDSRLTRLGERQAKEAKGRIEAIAPNLIITSPLTRALQTTRIISAGAFPVRVMSMVRERQYNSCDVGRPASVLAAEFPQWDFRHLAERWWYQDSRAVPDHRGIVIEPEQAFLARVARFRGLLGRCRGKPLVIVGHYTFFYHFCGIELGNCECYELPDEQ